MPQAGLNTPRGRHQTAPGLPGTGIPSHVQVHQATLLNCVLVPAELVPMGCCVCQDAAAVKAAAPLIFTLGRLRVAATLRRPATAVCCMCHKDVCDRDVCHRDVCDRDVCLRDVGHRDVCHRGMCATGMCATKPVRRKTECSLRVECTACQGSQRMAGMLRVDWVPHESIEGRLEVATCACETRRPGLLRSGPRLVHWRTL